jgi:hypothetical protein
VNEGASLKKVADAWRPIYQTLNSDQKERLRRRMEMMELEEDEAD